MTNNATAGAKSTANVAVAGMRAASVATGAGAGAAGTAGLPAAGVQASAGTAGLPAAGNSQPPNDSDAGPAADSSTDVTIIAEASFAPVSLMVEGATCAAGRCTLAAPSDGMLKVALTLEHKQGEPMPVLARWQGCGMPETSFFPVTPGAADYILMYESTFTGLRAGATCKAEIVEGGWLVFAGNMSLQVVDGQPFCAALQVSPMGVNASCFPPPGTSVAVESDLPRWNCVRIEQDGTAQDVSYTQMRLNLMSSANQLISCTGATQ